MSTIFNKPFGGLPWEYFLREKEKPKFIDGEDILVCKLCRNSSNRIIHGRVHEGDDIYLLIDEDPTKYPVALKDDGKLTVPTDTLLRYFSNYEFELSEEYKTYLNDEQLSQFLLEKYGDPSNPFNPISLNQELSILEDRWYLGTYPFSDCKLHRWVKNRLYNLNHVEREHITYDEEGNELCSVPTIETLPDDFILTIQNYLTDSYYNLLDDAPSDKINHEKWETIQTISDMMLPRDRNWMVKGDIRRRRKNPPLSPFRNRETPEKKDDRTDDEKRRDEILEQLSFFSAINDKNDIKALTRDGEHYNLLGYTPPQFKALYEYALNHGLLPNSHIHLINEDFRPYIYQPDGTPYSEKNGKSKWWNGQKWSDKKPKPKWYT